MSANVPVQDYSINAALQVAATSTAAATTAAQAAITAINTALKTLANGTELSIAEDPPGSIAFGEPDGVAGNYSAQGALLVGAVNQGAAQTAAEAAAAAITTAIAGLPGTVVTLEIENGSYVFSLLQ